MTIGYDKPSTFSHSVIGVLSKLGWKGKLTGIKNARHHEWKPGPR